MSENLVQKLLKAQKELKAPKGNFNSFGKYKYRSAEDILEAVKPLNAEHGLLLTLTDEPVFIGDWHYIKATATITDGENTHAVNAYARESQEKKGMDHSQITGTASSYARKYALNGLYLIDDTKDADTDEYQNQNKKPAANAVKPKQIGIIKTKVDRLAKLRNVKNDDIFGHLKVKSIEKLNEEQATRIIETLDKWIKQADKEEAQKEQGAS